MYGKDFPNGYHAGLDDGALIWVLGPNARLAFYPFKIDRRHEDHVEIEGEIYRYAGAANHISFEKTEEGTWDLGIFSSDLRTYMYDVPLELREHLVNLCNEFHDSHGIPPWVKQKRSM